MKYVPQLLLDISQLRRRTAGTTGMEEDVRILTSSSQCIRCANAATSLLAGFLRELDVVVSGPSGWTAAVRALFRARQGRALVRYEYTVHRTRLAVSYYCMPFVFPFSSSFIHRVPNSN
jgi:hypothetical protein